MRKIAKICTRTSTVGEGQKHGNLRYRKAETVITGMKNEAENAKSKSMEPIDGTDILNKKRSGYFIQTFGHAKI